MTVPPKRRFDAFEWLNSHRGIADAAVSAVLAALVAASALIIGTDGSGPWWTVGMLVCAAFLRTHTEVATLALGSLALAHFAFGPPFVAGDLLIFYAVYQCVVRARPFARRLAVITAVIGALLASVQVYVSSHYEFDATVAVVASVFVLGSSGTIIFGTWALGRYQRVKLNRLDVARERAEQAEREREQLAQLAVAAERSRIAREMHDVVAHSLSVIIAQADGGKYVSQSSPDKATEVFETIASTGRSALTDMRSLLGVLRDEASNERSPQPGLAQLPKLIESYEASGLDVRIYHEGASPESPVLDLTLLRIIQESLTNVLKHAGTSVTVDVYMERTSAEWQLTITNSPPTPGQEPPTYPSAGQGLRGMAERVHALGGSLSAGPTPEGGFIVRARIPSPPGHSPSNRSPITRETGPTLTPPARQFRPQTSPAER